MAESEACTSRRSSMGGIRQSSRRRYADGGSSQCGSVARRLHEDLRRCCPSVRAANLTSHALDTGGIDNADANLVISNRLTTAELLLATERSSTGARLQNANLQGVSVHRSRSQGSSPYWRQFESGDILGTQIDEADFTGVNFTRAAVQRMRLNVACFDGANSGGGPIQRVRFSGNASEQGGLPWRIYG